MTYGSEEEAYRRVEVLKRAGIWPGVRRDGDKWRLTFDPFLVSSGVMTL